MRFTEKLKYVFSARKTLHTEFRRDESCARIHFFVVNGFGYLKII